MFQTFRIGSQIGPYDPFWVQVREAVEQKAQQLGLELIPLEIAGRPDTLPVEEQIGVLEELFAQALDALICWSFPERMIHQILERGLPVIYLSEAKLRHPLFVSPHGLYEAGRMIGDYFAGRLAGRGQVVCIGGLSEEPDREDGRTRINGFHDALRHFPAISTKHISSYWRYEQAYPQIEAALKHMQTPIDAVFGLSDPIALAARDVLRSSGWMRKDTLIAGVNGDPLALVALAEGSLSATVETSTLEFGSQAVELAYRAARKETLPDHFGYQPRLVTAENLTAVALQKLLAIADLPTRLVGVNRQLEQNRLTQMETSAAINRRVGGLLDRRQLSHEIANLIRDNYGYDHVQLFKWSQEDQAFILEQGADESLAGKRVIPLERSGIFGEALRRNEPIFIPDTRYSYRFPSDPNWPDTLSRVVLPIRLGETFLGLLDLHSQHSGLHLRQELVGLEPLADQLGIAIRNAELYAEALQARAVAEKADRLKTRLLANVGHELRAPLNIILGYSQAALSTPNPYGSELSEGLRRAIGYIFRSCEHLTRLINDLLDLSRAEINQLDIFPETIPTRFFLEDMFHSMANTSSGTVAWQLCLPDRLPLIQADPVRLRQILLNLLSNASKFTTSGQIVLGAAVDPPHLHLWVQDTGSGIPVELQERIFEPFVTVERLSQRSEGIGLGLSITRRLVALHGGIMSLESRLGEGSTFHVYLPLPNLAGKFSAPPAELTTEVFVKPVASKTLVEAINAVRPAEGAGPILIVDDEAEARDYYQRIVHEALPGCPVLSAENGAVALASMRKTTPSLVILDLMMPEIDGFMVLEKMRSRPETRHIPVLVMSGKLLSTEDIRRLDYARVTFQSKGWLSDDEAVALLRKISEPGEALPQPTSVLVKAAIAYLHQNYARPMTRQEIAQAVGVSSSYLSRIFHREVGLSAWDCLNRVRILKARELLGHSTETIAAIAARVGFDDPAYFSRMFRKHTGQSPQSYRRIGK